MINHAIALACLCCARTALKNDGACPGLSLKNRFIGAIVTLGLAALWFALAIFVLAAAQITTFAIYYSLGNIAAIAWCERLSSSQL
jgi:hypothetical protein